jgi:hypothetical protein
MLEQELALPMDSRQRGRQLLLTTQRDIQVVLPARAYPQFDNVLPTSLAMYCTTAYVSQLGTYLDVSVITS